MNLIEYVRKYGNISFKEKEINDIDNLVFSSLSYLNFSSTSIEENNHSLEKVGREYLKTHSYRAVKKLGIAQKDAYKLLKVAIMKERYKNIIVSDYVYKTNKEMQFSAVTFHISKNLKYIGFEGTDERISGWKEDCRLAYMFPVPAHLEAINYVNQHVELFGPNVILGGHSKGGNLALIAGMYIQKYKKRKIKKIYNNDGPGLLEKEFHSKEYNQIKKKYVHIVPDSSVVGVLLNHDTYTVVKSNKKNILCHSMATWMIDKNGLVKSTLSEKSKRLESSILSWLSMYSNQQKNKLTNSLFGVFEDSNVEDFVKLRKLPNLIKVLFHIKKMDLESKRITFDLFSYNYSNMKNS